MSVGNEPAEAFFAKFELEIVSDFSTLASMIDAVRRGESAERLVEHVERLAWEIRDYRKVEGGLPPTAAIELALRGSKP